jgi:hypothetical protein
MIAHQRCPRANTQYGQNLRHRKRRETTTHQLDPVQFRVLALDIIVDIPLIHPLGYQTQLVVVYCRTEKRENIRVAEMFPGYSFFAEPLNHVTGITRSNHGSRNIQSSVLTVSGSSTLRGTWRRMILMATFRPLTVLWNI